MAANNTQPLLPKDLYPVVHDLSEAEYNGSCCGDLFTFFSLCNEGGEITQTRGKTNLPKRDRHEKRDSMATTATVPLQEDHPLKSQYRVPISSTACDARDSLLEADDDDSVGKRSKSSPLATPPRRKRLHIRRRSRQLISLLLVRSNSMSSSTREMSTTEVSMDSQTFEERRFHDKYVLTRRMFHSSSSQIWECLERETGILHCVKTMNFLDEEAYDELEMHHSLNQHGHPGLCRLVESFEEKSKVYMVMECLSDNLLTVVVRDRPMEEDCVRAITKSLLESLLFLHNQNVCHGALEPSNVCLTGLGDTEAHPCKIVDFGSAIDLSVEIPYGSSQMGNEGYCAPEMLQKFESYNCVADIWSLGCLVFFMFTGLSPFEDTLLSNSTRSAHEKMARILRGEYSFSSQYFRDVSRSAKQFISSLIHTDPSVRPTAAEALEHPWLRVVEKAHQGSFFRRRNSPGNDVNKASLSEAACVTPLNPSSATSPPDGQRSATKHHRRLTSMTKGISKLFSSKEQAPNSAMVPGEEHNTSNEIVASSSFGGVVRSERRIRKHHRRMVTR